MKSLKVLLPELSPAQFTLLENAILKYVIGPEDLRGVEFHQIVNDTAYIRNKLRTQQTANLKQLMKGGI